MKSSRTSTVCWWVRPQGVDSADGRGSRGVAPILLVLAVGLAACARAPVARPPIVLISVDTLRADHLPAYGYRGLETPGIDSLARDSIRFENAYSRVPLTIPSHAVLLTGLLPYGRSGASADALVRWAADVRDKPLFFFLHIYEPHAPHTSPEPLRSRYPDRPYDGEIAAADAGIGRLLDFLKRAGLYDRAAALLLSDPREGLGGHGEDEHGVFLYRETLRVPLFWKRAAPTPVG